ncbi:MAG: tRNA (adenosine(37)-N6)-dimethylallyltransferase MiaA [Nitrospinaceae bacterium]|nr:tRNA (adenosine(37)-N6)-dimethylallyltransferase MiaA [Candidatus Latescibacterota bacterium]MEE1551530.1 tRNA (adenosine(37)-N6)-dimethylallyltransferase MiaA [Nitrospinaceae bacterium]
MAVDSQVFVIAGPTASGKTSVAIDLAQKLGGEIISADARQIYRFMDIGTAKPTAEEQASARHHLIDVVDPDAHYSAGQFAEDAAEVVRDILQRGKLPIVVGGAGLYIRALLDGFSPMPEIPLEIRERLQVEAKQNLQGAYERLCSIDPEWAKKVQPGDVQRIVRGLEVFEASGVKLSDHQKLPPNPPGDWSSSWFAIKWDREVLYDRINKRALQMIDDGLVAEAEGLIEKGYTPDLNALRTFGYREFFAFLAGDVTLEDAVVELQQGTRRYAKRQLTWFRREKRIHWISAEEQDPVERILKRLEKA